MWNWLSSLGQGLGGWLKGLDFGGLFKTLSPLLMKGLSGLIAGREGGARGPYYMPAPPTGAAQYLPEGLPQYTAERADIAPLLAAMASIQPTEAEGIPARQAAIEAAYGPKTMEAVLDRIRGLVPGPQQRGGRYGTYLLEEAMKQFALPKAGKLAGVIPDYAKTRAALAGPMAGLAGAMGRLSAADADRMLKAQMIDPSLASLIKGAYPAGGFAPGIAGQKTYPNWANFLSGLMGSGGFDWGKIFGGGDNLWDQWSVADEDTEGDWWGPSGGGLE